MVLDRSRVKLGLSVDDGALTVVEQIPGLVEYSDQTQALRRGNDASFDPVFLRSLFHVQSFSFPPFTKGYWPSYNVPFHHKIYKLSGYEEMWDKHGEDFSYDLCSRAKIFRRDQADVKDLDSLKRIMRSNGVLLRLLLVLSDSLSAGSPYQLEPAFPMFSQGPMIKPTR